MKKMLLLITAATLIMSCAKKSSPTEFAGERIVVYQIDSGTDAHFRGINALSDETVWLSGTKGTVLRTTNGGEKWKDLTVPGCDSLDFRDIHALDEDRAWVMSSGNGVRVYYTENGGKKWTLQFEDKNSNVFLDGMDFYDEKNGIIYGDPIDDVMDVLVTSDGGENWTRIPKEKLPLAWEDEAGFAASGTGVVHQGQKIWMATGGGEISRIIKSEDGGQTWKAVLTPIIGGTGSGIFSMAFKDDKNGVVVGGNYVDSTSVKFNCAYTIDGGDSWSLVENNGPRGYRSCVTITPSGTAVACGRTGIERSEDFKTWQYVSDEGYFTCDAGNNYVWFAGRSGKVGKIAIK